MKVVLLDGYVDEPSCLGVPPFISPYVRYAAGAISECGHDYTYFTIDEYRSNSPKTKTLNKSNLLIVIGGAIVPGKYLRGTPASVNEIADLAGNFQGTKILGGPIARFGFSGDRKAEKLQETFDFIAEKDADAYIYDLLKEKLIDDRLRTQSEWRRWAKSGSSIIKQHPDFPNPLIIELETYRGCVRYLSGGCSFCIEPLFRKPRIRETKDIIDEVSQLYNQGAVNFRLGAQSCIFSYGTKELGESETPKPNPDRVEKLLKGIRNSAPNLQVLHTDNANPTVIAEHPKEATRILKSIVKYCTSGNVLALGMESADPKVISENNLNSTPEQVMKAIELINEYGRDRGETGLPRLLPGLNFISGLKGESKRTFGYNFQFLYEVLKAGLLLRRINIRQVAFVRTRFNVKTHRQEFIRFKKRVREEIDYEMLKRLVPADTILKKVLIEKVQGNLSFGRQVGTYPLLIGIPYKTEINDFMDVIITDYGFRSVTGIEYPMDVHKASLRALSSIPGVGKKRAARIIRSRPFHSDADFLSSLDDEKVAQKVLSYINF
jgi:radical SAM superfamily enzyme with C-terminal helix-hairpin-helix motif